jgi:hypothetical protein
VRDRADDRRGQQPLGALTRARSASRRRRGRGRKAGARAAPPRVRRQRLQRVALQRRGPIIRALRRPRRRRCVLSLARSRLASPPPGAARSGSGHPPRGRGLLRRCSNSNATQRQCVTFVVKQQRTRSNSVAGEAPQPHTAAAHRSRAPQQVLHARSCG